MAKLKIKNKIIIFFVVIYTVYLSVILAYTYVNNKDILESALKDRITQTYYQLSGNISENIKTENTYEIYQKIHSASVNKEVAYIIIYDNEKNILGKTLKDVPEKLLIFNDEQLNSFKRYGSSRGELLEYISPIDDVNIGYVRVGFYTKNIYMKTYSQFLRILILNMIVFVMLLVIAYYVSKLIERPVQDLTSVTDEIIREGDYRTKIEKDNPLYVKKNEKLDGIFDEIREKESKTHEKEAPALEVRELDAEGSRREKLKYTSVHDVLEGNEDLFEDDIDRVSKKLVGERFEEGQKSSEEVENFRKGLYEGKKSENTQERTALDELIKAENIDVSPRKEETLPEIEELNENLADLKKEKQEETYVDLVQEAAKIEDIEVEDYEEIKEVKKDRLSGYSDYHLNEDEIEELEEQNYLEESADSVNIDSLIREVSPNNKIIKKANDVDKFTDEKVVPKEVVEKRVEDAKVREESEQVEEVERGIDYTEKLYTNDVSEYFDKGNGAKLGEYKTVDHGYRPVSKEKIENNQKILDAIFEKYSSSGISTSTRSVTSQMMSSNTITPKSRSVGKFKPSPVYSSVYGSATRNTAENSNKPVGISTTGLSINNQVKKDEPKIDEKKAVEAKTVTTVKNNANIYKEIASQEETVWNIGSAKRVPKNKVKNKK